MSVTSLFIVIALGALSATSVQAADAAPAAAAEVKGPPPWTEVQSRMLVYKGQRQQLMGEMQNLRAQQREMKMGTPEMKKTGEAIVKAYKEYKELTLEYNQLLGTLRYRYPERLAKEALQIHKPEEVPALEELEVQLDLEARLSRTVDKARDQYGADPTAEGRQPSSVDAGAPPLNLMPTLRESPAIILKK